MWILIAWYEAGNSGLSIFALATVVNRSPKRLLREFNKSAHVGVFWCEETHLPLWGVDCCNDTDALNQQTALLKQYKWPAYKGLRDGDAEDNKGLKGPGIGSFGFDSASLRAKATQLADDYNIRLVFKSVPKRHK